MTTSTDATTVRRVDWGSLCARPRESERGLRIEPAHRARPRPRRARPGRTVIVDTGIGDAVEDTVVWYRPRPSPTAVALASAGLHATTPPPEAPFGDGPFEPLGAVSHPFAFFRFLSTLFDDPSRDLVTDMDWVALSFLCRLGGPEGRSVLPLLALAPGALWGFTASAGVVTLHGRAELDVVGWETHRIVVERDHLGWTFGWFASRSGR